jgi:hypothetical protein
MLMICSSLDPLHDLRQIALALGQACGGSIVPFRAGRNDVNAADVADLVPLPEQSLATHQSMFARMGFNQEEMISLVACGYVVRFYQLDFDCLSRLLLLSFYCVPDRSPSLSWFSATPLAVSIPLPALTLPLPNSLLSTPPGPSSTISSLESTSTTRSSTLSPNLTTSTIPEGAAMLGSSSLTTTRPSAPTPTTKTRSKLDVRESSAKCTMKVRSSLEIWIVPKFYELTRLDLLRCVRSGALRNLPHLPNRTVSCLPRLHRIAPCGLT